MNEMTALNGKIKTDATGVISTDHALTLSTLVEVNMANASLPKSNSKSKKCSVEGCERKYSCKTYCHMHYVRVLTYGDPLGRRRPTMAERFWSKVDKDGPYREELKSACWLWTAGHFSEGYGTFRCADRNTRGAHRVAFYLANGYWPEPLCLHKCDTPACVNPEHLYAGTDADNSRDRSVRGRSGDIRGEKNKNAKLSAHNVREIRKCLEQGLSLNKTAQLFGVSKKAVYSIKARKTWTWLED